MRGLWMTMAGAVCAVGLAATPAAAATVLGVNWTSDCSKTTCFNDEGVYTRTWTAADAAGPLTISQFLMDRGVLGDLDSKTFSISFSIGGQDVGSWGKFTMGGIAGDKLNFSGADFVWNPQDGDLVLTLTIIPPPKAGLGGGMALTADPDGQDTPFAPKPPAGGGNDGPVTPHGLPDPGGQPAPQGAAVPEPATWTLMIGGFGLAGASLRRRRLAAARA